MFAVISFICEIDVQLVLTDLGDIFCVSAFDKKKEKVKTSYRTRNQPGVLFNGQSSFQEHASSRVYDFNKQ